MSIFCDENLYNCLTKIIIVQKHIVILVKQINKIHSGGALLNNTIQDPNFGY